MGCVEERASVWVDLSLRRATWVQFVNAPAVRDLPVFFGYKIHQRPLCQGRWGPKPRVGAGAVPVAWLHGSSPSGAPGVDGCGRRVAGGAQAARGGACSGRRCPQAPSRGGRRGGQLERAGAEKVEPPRPPPGLSWSQNSGPWGEFLGRGSGPITRART